MSALNGMVGDYLHERQNGLAIETAFYHQNRPLPLTKPAIQQAHPQPTTRLCVLIHGLGCHEGIWDFPHPKDPQQTTSYGDLLHADQGYTPLFVRYNTGVSVAENGKRLALLLDDLSAVYPISITEMVLIGHSMGGLVIRSACHYATEQGLAWVQQVTRAFYLGTPHTGANLERVANAATNILRTVPNPVTAIITNVLHLRSRGIKDLHNGRLVEPIASDGRTQEQPVAWLPHIQHYLINGALTNDPEHAITVLFGDGLVNVPGSGGAGTSAQHRPIPAEHIRLFPRTNHFQLAHDWAVYQQIALWCTPV